MPRLPPGERRGEEHRARASEKRAAVYHWVLSQAVCESGARGCGAWGNRAGSMQEPSLQAERSVAELVDGDRREEVRAALRVRSVDGRLQARDTGAGHDRHGCARRASISGICPLPMR
jgi:hypothetical protein